MKKLDKLILSSFIGPFLLTFVVVVFILLNQHMLRYFNDIIGKGLGFGVLGELFFYFAIFMIPLSIPLAVLLSSLITFSNLGEHSELTAIKSLGISLTRTIAPLFLCVILITVLALYINNYLVPKAALEAYSLLYDIRQKKPALDLKPGIFYNTIPGINIKANYKFPDGQTLKDIIIYDHRQGDAENSVIMADSGRMYTIHNGQYLQLELFNGLSYDEGIINKKNAGKTQMMQTSSKVKFAETKIVFDLSSFALTRTKKEWFKGHRIMRNLDELQQDMDSMDAVVAGHQLNAFIFLRDGLFSHFGKGDTIPVPPDLIARAKKHSLSGLLAQNEAMLKRDSAMIASDTLSTGVENTLDSLLLARYDNVMNSKPDMAVLQAALQKARDVKGRLLGYASSIKTDVREFKIFQIQWNKIFANSFACLSMFLIGAPLGTIIRKGGLGIPVLISILFFVAFYSMSVVGEKWGRQGVTSVPAGVWAANAVLLLIGAFFSSRARADTRLLDADFYNVVWDKLRKRLGIG